MNFYESQGLEKQILINMAKSLLMSLSGLMAKMTINILKYRTKMYDGGN